MENDILNETINSLHKVLEAKDKIINGQVLEISRLKEDLKDACYVIEKIKKEKQQAIEYIKDLYDVRFTDKDKRKLLAILGGNNEYRGDNFI